MVEPAQMKSLVLGKVTAMAYSRYPRRGHRIAPATLAELLQQPIPEKYRRSPDTRGLTLADLDESAWALFEPEACRHLAAEVVARVGRAARMMLSIGNRPLPALPEGVTLADLDLEVRTANCLVAAGIHERPQDLAGMTIEGVLGLRGFWSKSLVDLLTAMEHVIDHPEARRSSRDEPPLSIRQPMGAHRYPQANHRIAPSMLKDLLDEEIPRHLVEGTPFAGARLADLDESAWGCLSTEAISELAGMVISRVGMGVVNRDVQQLHLPRVPAGLRLENLRLENRTGNCLRRLGLATNLQQLGKMTVDDLMQVPSFGAKCLVDLLTALETFSHRGQCINANVMEHANQLAQRPEAASIHFSDPRLGRLLRAMDSESNTLEEMIERIRLQELDLAEPYCLVEGMGRLVAEIQRFEALPIEDELKDIFAPMANARDQQILAAYYNWDGKGGRTLEQLGQKYGLSRERIRQICMRCVKRVRHVPIFAPVLDRALAWIASRLPRAAHRLEGELREAGLSRDGLPIATVEEAARFFSRTPAFRVVPVGEGAVAVEPGQAELPPRIAQAARSAVGSFGVANVAEVQAELTGNRPRRRVGRQLLQETLSTLRNFQWLDARPHWFRLETLPQYGLPNMIEKVVSVAGRIDVVRLRAAMSRYRRSGRELPPPGPLLEYCRQMPSVRVEGDAVVAEPSLDWRTVLAGVERGMVEVLREFGPVMDRGEFEEHCIRRGMNRFSFNAILMCSPVVAQYGRSIYGLVAQKTDRRTVRRARAQRSRVMPSRVLQTCGVEADGRPYVVYRLSKAAIAGGVITIPAALKQSISGEYTVISVQRERLGRMVAKRGCGWGLGPVLRGSDAQPGQYLLMQFDNDARTATFRLGDARLATRPLPDETEPQTPRTVARGVSGVPAATSPQ